MSVIDEIKSRIDIVDLISESVSLRRSGKNYLGFCPFHTNTRTPAFVVFPESGTWRCFGQCNEGGDVFAFVMKKEGVDFAQALQILAQKAGVVLKPLTAQETAERQEHETWRALLEDAVTFYRHQLLNTEAGKQALEYLSGRGLRAETLEAFGIGYAPNRWDALLQHLTAKGASIPDLVQVGLVSEGQDGGVHDRFRHRIMIPIRDEQGRMAGFGARVLDPKDVPKFLNSPQTPLFDKGRLLYGLDHARRAIREKDQAVLVEGYLDVLALHQAGFANVVSPMGTALTEHQLSLLKRLSKRLVLALDADVAGEKATLRGLEVARQVMDRSQEMVFDSRGLLRIEARLQADLRVATLPPGLDPDEIVQTDPQHWERIIAEAKPIVVHVMEILAEQRDLNDPKQKDEVANLVLPLISEVANPLERDTYLQRLARLLRVDERALLSRLSSARKPARRSPKTETTSSPSQPAPIPLAQSLFSLEQHILGVLLRFPDLLYRLDRALQEDELERLSPSDFSCAEHQTLLRLLQESLEQDLVEPLQYVLQHLSLPMLEISEALLEKSQGLEGPSQRILDDLLRAVLQLRQRSLNQQIEYLRFTLQEAEEQHTSFDPSLRSEILALAQRRLKIDKALKKATS
ncbi:MAG: DNA primase, partial [Anaerolineales bacterium]|nr:DNA primase [Anaerolineales bacterium]MDW8446996.1 DNA primase [Anaerolineales bacterium]